ncbi:hypothetical protein JCM8097_006376 [Rhodosporidiobolus ruineniae]
MALPDIVPSSEQGQALQAAIQKQLAVLGWSTEDDSVMAEYCLVMLGNRKTADQISTELSDLIGGDFDASFVTWLFDEVKKHYPDPSASPAASSAPASSSSNSVPSRPSAPQGAGGRNVFGAAVTGVKRGASELDEREARRQRFSNDGGAVPTGPRGARNGDGAAAGGGKSLFDRVNGSNPQFARGRNLGPVNNTGMPQPAFDAITQTVNAILSGAHPSILANIPYPALAAHPLSQRLPPHVMAQAQANAMAQAQAFAAMQNVWNTPPGAAAAFGAGAGLGGGLNAQAPAFNPAFSAPAPARAARPTSSKPATPPVVLPSKPEKEDLCKHGVECTKPQCLFSHPSPVATKESGLVLKSEACEKQLKCEDPDCEKSHVSVAQKKSPPSAVSSGTKALAAARAPTTTAFSATGGANGTPCKFGAACTRPGCYFVHPWDVSGVPGGAAAGGATACRYGAGCTRADCHFSHPPSRPTPYRSTKFSSSSSAAAKKAPQASGIGAWPTESKEHISERLKRFSGGGAGEGKKDGQGEGDEGAERIVPGEKTGKDGEEHKVEIHLDDDEEKEKDKDGKKEPAPAAA